MWENTVRVPNIGEKLVRATSKSPSRVFRHPSLGGKGPIVCISWRVWSSHSPGVACVDVKLEFGCGQSVRGRSKR
jgi:hypothetical protein